LSQLNKNSSLIHSYSGGGPLLLGWLSKLSAGG